MIAKDVRDIIKDKGITYFKRDWNDTDEEAQLKRDESTRKVAKWVRDLVMNENRYEDNYKMIRKFSQCDPGGPAHLAHLTIAELLDREGRRLRGMECLRIA